MEFPKATITLRIPKTLNDELTACAKRRGLAKSSLLIISIEELVKKERVANAEWRGEKT